MRRLRRWRSGESQELDVFVLFFFSSFLFLFFLFIIFCFFRDFLLDLVERVLCHISSYLGRGLFVQCPFAFARLGSIAIPFGSPSLVAHCQSEVPEGVSMTDDNPWCEFF